MPTREETFIEDSRQPDLVRPVIADRAAFRRLNLADVNITETLRIVALLAAVFATLPENTPFPVRLRE
jgi:hypothetical protein